MIRLYLTDFHLAEWVSVNVYKLASSGQEHLFVRCEDVVQM